MSEKMSKPRADFLRDAVSGVHAVEEYKPAQWALTKGYVTVVEGRFGSRMHHITEAGRAALLRAGEAVTW